MAPLGGQVLVGRGPATGRVGPAPKEPSGKGDRGRGGPAGRGKAPACWSPGHDPCDDRAVRTLFASYLRVYEPLSAFDRRSQVYWRRYVHEGRAVTPADGPGRQRTAVLEALGAGWTRPPELPDGRARAQ